MKRITSYLVCTFVALALIGTLTTCVPEYVEPGNGYGGNGTLSVKSTVSEATLVTRATTESDATLMEKQLNTLDVFVEHVTNGVGDGTFLQQYHLPYPSDYDYPSDVPNESKKIGDQVKSFLKDHWRQGQGGNDGLKFNDYYNIYVAVNNTKTTSNVESVTALKALTYSEVEEGLAVVNEATNNISWPWTDQFAHTPSGFIYKQYVDGDDEEAVNEVTIDGDLYGFTTKKEFMMDGVIENWTPVAGSKDQVFGDDNKPLILNRAAAKFVLNVKFDATFLKSLQYKKNDDGTYTDLKPENERITITGKPAWRFYNFAFGAPVFTPETQGAGVEVHSSETLLKHPYAYAGDDKHFQIITYSYPNKWATADYSTSAPSLVISVGYTENGVTNYHYYRIPLVKNTVTAIERNHIYEVNATIATKGSAVQEDVTVTENIQYKVLPWNDEFNSAAIHSDVQSVQHQYLKVNPKVYTLRGDGEQSVTINYLKATGTSVGWKLFTYDNQGHQISVVANDAEGASRAWFYNSTGAFTTTYSDSGTSDWSKMGVTITQSNEGIDKSSGTFEVKSTALTNKAIKYIRFRVYLKENESLYQDVIIRHFPTDNIQNIAGSWSSYHDSNNSTEMVTITTRSKAIAESWKEEYNKEYTTETINATDYITYAVYSAHAGEDGYAILNNRQNTDRNTFRRQVPSNEKRRAANGQNNAVLGEDGYCYWGVNPSLYYGGGDDDYYTGSGWNTQFYRYQNLYRARYTHTYTYTQYSMTVPGASTGDWVDWDASDKSQHSVRREYIANYGDYSYYYERYEGSFQAKEMNGTTMYLIEENSHGSGFNRYYSTDEGDEVNNSNNHMYVIQISSTSDKYVLGRPYINTTTHQSQDNVVSPAFMIASQLGAVLPFTGDNGPSNAATHCSRYMEVAEDGTRYTDWRLPTQAEIEVITGYQYGTIGGVEIPSAYQVISPVLTGRWYHSLSGQEVEANPDADQYSSTKSYLRCVRDLTAEEIDRLNGFDKIIEQYQ